jgi:hypothetical protein
MEYSSGQNITALLSLDTMEIQIANIQQQQVQITHNIHNQMAPQAEIQPRSVVTQHINMNMGNGNSQQVGNGQ